MEEKKGESMENIYKREVADTIISFLDSDDILVLTGARQVGKTYLLRYVQQYLEKKKERVAYLDLEDSRFVQLLDNGVDALLSYLREEGLLATKPRRTYLLIDEIQYLARPASLLKLLHDHQPRLKLIVTGSSSLRIKQKFTDSLVGRTVQWEIWPLSFAEFLQFRGYRVKPRRISNPLHIAELKERYREFARYGGYPKVVLATERTRKETYLRQIIDTYLQKDITDWAEIREVDKFNKLLAVLASQSGALVNVAELSATCRLTVPTVEKYLLLLENTYIIKLVRPWSGSKRSELFKRPKIYFYDTGLMQTLWLGAIPPALTGAAFEASVFAELVKRYGVANVFFWRTAQQQEIDFILRFRPQARLPIEVKINWQQFRPSAIKSFQQRYRNKNYWVVALDGDKMNEHCRYPWELNLKI